MLFLSFLLITSALLTSVGPLVTVRADGESHVNKILCRVENGEILAKIHSTDFLYYLFRSKSAVTSVDRVSSSVLNKILMASGYDFVTPNEAILGRPIRPSTLPTGDDVPEGDPNESAPRVSVFDRFGMSGLKWSSYQGEWRFNYVNPCANQGEISPTTYGAFYQGRLEPQSTYNETAHSKDARTIQFNRGVFSNIGTAFLDLIANGLFSFSKLVVTLTIAFVGLAFTDITSLMGLNDDGSAGITSVSIFTELFDTIFQGFVVIAIICTAIYLLYNVVFKRQIRLGLTSLIRVIIVFLISTIMATNPAFWISAPNRIANVGQALVLSTMAGVYDRTGEDSSLCNTDIGSLYADVGLSDIDEESLMNDFEQLNANMRSLIGCQLWETLLFRPWVRGQFGAEYEDLLDEKVENVNTSWVGEAAVPVGGGETINNWAVFHLSTQTDAHAQVGDSNFPTVVNGVNADWWRVADALSNYEEGEASVEGAYFNDVLDTEPTEYWQSWIGNNSVERFGTALVTVFFSIAASVAPLFLSLSSAAFGLGITLMMMTAPIFMLAGVWGGKGESIFLGWLSALVNTIIKRVAVSILLILSISISLTTMDMVYTIGFIRAFLLMCILAYALIKNKNRLLGILANVNFGGAFDPRAQANQFFEKRKSEARSVGKIGLAATAGAATGYKTGVGIRKGAQLGTKSELRNTLYRSTVGRNVIRELDLTANKKKVKSHLCSICNITMEAGSVAYEDDYGNFICSTCIDEYGPENYNLIVLPEKQEKTHEKSERRTKSGTNEESFLSHTYAKERMNASLVNGKLYWDRKEVKNMAKENIRNLHIDMAVYKQSRQTKGSSSKPPRVPAMLDEYIDLALINETWSVGNLEAVENTYKEAWKLWYDKNARLAEGYTEEEISKFKREIENYKPDDIEDSELENAVERYNKKMRRQKEEQCPNDLLYVYRNGKLIRNTFK